MEQYTITETHQTYRDHARFRSHGGEKVVGGDEALPRRNHFHHDAFARFHRLPGGLLKREFTLGGEKFVSRFPSEHVRSLKNTHRSAGPDATPFRPLSRFL